MSEGVKKVWDDSDSVFNTEEWRAKMSAAIKEKYKDPEFLKKLQKGLKTRPNKSETKLLKIINEISEVKYEYTGDFSFWIDGKNPDYINQEEEKVIEFFGKYWHSEEMTGNTETEEENNRINHFVKNGFLCLIIWENELKDLQTLTEKIKKFIEIDNKFKERVLNE